MRSARRERWVLVVMLGVLTVGLAACGGGGKGAAKTSNETPTTTQTGSTAPSTGTQTQPTVPTTGTAPGAVSAGVYASSVCSAFNTWGRQLRASQAAFASSVASTKRLATVRSRLVGFLDKAALSTDAMLHQVRRAGKPNVTSGAAFAADLQRDLNRIRSIFIGLEGRAQTLPAKDRASFVRGLSKIEADLGTQLTALAKGLKSFRLSKGSAMPELARAARRSPACMKLLHT